MSNNRPDVSIPTDLRLAEVIGAISLATDLGMGNPLEYALCSCVLAVRLGDALGLGDEDLREVYYQALLRYIGCNAETHMLSSLAGDEAAVRADFGQIDTGNIGEVVGVMTRAIRQANAGASPTHVARMVARGLLTLPKIKASFAEHCEVAQRLGERLGFEGNVVRALGQLYERWDGKGSPRGLKGENVALSVRVVTIAQDAITFQRIGGTEAAVAIARKRKGTIYDPNIVERFCNLAPTLMAQLDEEPSWDMVLSLEPGKRVYLTEPQFDAACHAMADFTDIKSYYTLNHSTGVARIAADAARRCRLPDSDVKDIQRAGLLHDLGRISVSTAIWEKPGRLTEREWERVRMHAYYTERILAHSQTLARLGTMAGMHHERLDGSGYHRGAHASSLSPAQRILAAADVYQAMTERRAHRPALQPEAAAAELRREVHAGRLDSDAVTGVLAAAGHRVSQARLDMVAGLSSRQVEILRLLARGNSMKQIAALLTISEKTVDNHIQHIYNKIGVSTRAGATLFAMEQDLLNPSA
ncbi:MAG: HD domain-containing phosphohydrolase [Chloroflexota bacterium]